MARGGAPVTWVGMLLGACLLGSVAHAQPAAPVPPSSADPSNAPAPAPPVEPVMPTAAVVAAPAPVPTPTLLPAPVPPKPVLLASRLQLRAAAGFAHYGEQTQGFTFTADTQPFVQVTAEAGFQAGRGVIAVQAAAGVGTEVDMQGVQGGQVTQRNRFWQELYEASPRLRWPINPRMYVDGGYRLTVQRLHIIKIPTLGDALEVVTVHSLEAGFGWERHDAGGGGLAYDVIFGITRGSADNDRITGESFTAGGFSLSTRLSKRYRSGLTLDGHFQYRKQTGSSVQSVEFDGMPTMAVWPANTTFLLVAAAGYRF